MAVPQPEQPWHYYRIPCWNPSNYDADPWDPCWDPWDRGDRVVNLRTFINYRGPGGLGGPGGPCVGQLIKESF